MGGDSLDDGIANTSFNVGDASAGFVEFKANSSYGSEELTDIKIDFNPPDTLDTDQDYVSDGRDLTFTVGDELSQVESLEIENTNGEDGLVDESWDDVCSEGNTCEDTVNIDTGDIENGNTLDLEFTATDSLGNERTETFSVEVDNEYEGDDSPDFSIEGADDSNNILMDSDDEELDMTVELDSSEDEEAPVGVKCYVGGDMVEETDYEDVTDDSQEYTCEIDGEEYSGGTYDVYVEACDEAGNCVETDSESYSFDASSPFVAEFNTVKDYNVFNDDFEATFDAGDDASGVSEVEYVFNLATERGEGTPVEASSGENFSIDTSSLDSGEHTVYLRVKDGVDRWSDAESLNFEYYPNSRPQLDIEDPGNVTVTAGSSRSLDITVDNPGKLYVESATFTASAGDVVDVERSLSGLAAGGSTVVTLNLDTSSKDVGRYDLQLETSQPEDTVSTTLLVEANQEQEQTVESRVSNYSSKLEQLNQNLSQLRSGGLSPELNESLNSNVSEFVSSVRKAENFSEQGQYYRALSALEGIDEKYDRASRTYSDVKQQHELNERNRMLKMLGGLLLIVAIGGGVYVARSGEYELDLSEYRVPEMGGVTAGLGEKVESFKEFLAKEEEEVEEEFRGFA